MRVSRLLVLLLLAGLATLLPAGCASGGKQHSALERAQHAWSGAVRWNDVDAAWRLVDPDVRSARPLGELERARYAQVQVTGYRPLGGQAQGEGAAREVEISVVNRHTMAERTVRYTERWRWDASAGTWWITGGLPDLWAGE